MRTAAKHNIPRGRFEGTNPAQRVVKLPHIVDIGTAVDNAANAGDHEDYAALRTARREAIGKALKQRLVRQHVEAHIDRLERLEALTEVEKSISR